jgi:drug/metabolite transporter (DMT)-like permease
MDNSLKGELAALITAVFWTITALAFESASKKVGSLAVNILRLILGLVFLSIYVFISSGSFFPLNASMHTWIWLSLSGFIGFVSGRFISFSILYNNRSKNFNAGDGPFSANCSDNRLDIDE